MKEKAYDLSIVSKDNVIQAIDYIDKNGIESHAQSSTYDLIYNNKPYPPKLVLSLAYGYASGKNLDRSKFLGGINTDCFNCLEKLGFSIKPKKELNNSVTLKIGDDMSTFSTVLERFIEQANEAKSLKPSGYPETFRGLRVKVSFGKGNFARIPWISFLYEGQETQEGIYPVFLYYKKYNMLLLAYGVSETKRPPVTWSLSKKVGTIEEYFKSQGLGKPERYGKSYVFKAYNPSSLQYSQVEQDLGSIISEYRELMEGTSIKQKAIPMDKGVPFKIRRVEELEQTGLLFDIDLLYRYTVSLLTKPFVILSGLSGSGKTRLALTFAKWMGQDDTQIRIISVGADWNNREYLLGYPNALECGKYVMSENGVLDFILTAANNPGKPYFLILDEMNLSYVERYFSDFLSTMESHECITLHPNTREWAECDVPAQIKLPKNLFITGTINVDETTYMFSPKVLDRANVIEFRISESEMAKFLTDFKRLELDSVDQLGSNMGYDFVEIANTHNLENDAEYNQILLALFTELKKAGAEFGYRTVSEIYRFITLANKLQTNWDKDQLIDITIMQKMLPKLHGSRKKMQPILNSLWTLCLEPNLIDSEKILIESDQFPTIEKFRYPISADKIWHMFRNAKDNGFTSYAEA